MERVLYSLEQSLLDVSCGRRLAHLAAHYITASVAVHFAIRVIPDGIDLHRLGRYLSKIFYMHQNNDMAYRGFASDDWGVRRPLGAPGARLE